jgi:hypothetical protein
MVLRWVASSLHEASRGFRAVRGYRDMKTFITALTQRVHTTSDAQRKVA